MNPTSASMECSEEKSSVQCENVTLTEKTYIF